MLTLISFRIGSRAREVSAKWVKGTSALEDAVDVILAMDSYNRGYGAGLIFAGNSDQQGTVIGNATVYRSKGDAEAQAAGFYGTAYNVGNVSGFSAGEKVISYRGTNTDSLGALGDDIIDGWTVGTGSPAELQAKLATQFFNAVRGAGAPRLANVTLTGHSLGGGLAGLVGGLYGLKGVLFDHMPFEAAIDTTYLNAVGDGAVDAVAGNEQPTTANDNLAVQMAA